MPLHGRVVTCLALTGCDTQLFVGEHKSLDMAVTRVAGPLCSIQVFSGGWRDAPPHPKVTKMFTLLLL